MTDTIEEPRKEPSDNKPEEAQLTDTVAEPRKEPLEEKPGGTKRKPAIIIGIVCVGVVAAAIAMNFDRLSAQPGVSEPPPTPNTAPVILSLTPATDRIEPLDLCEVVCEAEDDDGDALIYTWAASQGEVIGEGATVEWDAPDTEGLFRLSVTVDDGNGDTAEYSTSLRVKKNYAPEFVSVSASAEGILPGTSTSISCSAEDADGDEVTYEWTAQVGELFGEGTSIIWLAPEQPGTYMVTVVARDSYGAETRHDIPMTVAQAAAPQLGEFVVTPINHNMLHLETGVWDIFQGRSCSVTCVVAEGSEPYTYTWSVDEGELTSDGTPTAVWEAQMRKGPATISVDVTDVNGTTTTGVVLMYVETCTCHFD